ncbi:transcriptional regulator [Pseudoalteromonas luteoviolacea 2ta16]|uniref:Transcriptional regulator n=2 Tax=Pseudoalteromonas luteoviolacea TaxID=43657 RepID=V4JC30_PSEL2|nr:transcriptional regulator [Pseudoalteromonas luteoviolacea 2ta16]
MNINWMDIKKLNYVVTVAQELSFSRAAQKLHMSQPPLSQQIRQIEQYLGMPLFERSTRSVSLTTFGALFVSKAQRVLAAHNDLGECVKSFQNGVQQPIKLGCIGLAFEALMAKKMAILSECSPKLDLALEEGSSAELVARCQSGQLHGAIIRLFAPDLPAENIHYLCSERYVFACPKQWHLESTVSSIKALCGKPFIHYPKALQPKLHEAIEEVFHQAKATMNVVQEVKTKSTTLSLVAAGLGFAIVPQSMMNKYQSQVDFIAIEEHLPSVDYYLYCQDWQVHHQIKNLYQLLSEP